MLLVCCQCQHGALGLLLPRLPPRCPCCMHCPAQARHGCGAAGAASLSPNRVPNLLLVGNPETFTPCSPAHTRSLLPFPSSGPEHV